MSTQKAQQSESDTSQGLNVPTHLGLILDGNRRWAKDRGMPAFEGHRQGYLNLKTIAQAARERGVKYLSAFVFSTENWQRSKEEVNYLMNLFYWVATHEVDELHKNNVRLRFIGSEEHLTPKLLKAMREVEEKTKSNSGGTLALCLNYGGKQEIADAAAAMIRDGVKAEDVTPEKISSYLYAPDIPPVDLVIRTSGEQRISGFMLWRAEYSEMLFVKKHWPDFTVEDLDSALSTFANRDRRFGK
ncbi:MAG TPA: polyprenyl diphosphate synthase [Candidatus Nanoarchaeia archaeon]|nr:polyprenyl diphosphate synthase [Candidatus Nanoarchaeia archaeon]